MLDLFSTSHLLIIAVAMLVLLGPKDIPRFMRKAGGYWKKLRETADEFRRGFDDLERQSEMDELRREMAALRNRDAGAAPIKSETTA